MINEVDKVEILTLQDNYIDLMARSSFPPSRVSPSKRPV